MFNDLADVWASVPPSLAAAWAVWLGAGALLWWWYRRAKATLALQQAAASRALARARSGPRPPSGARPPATPRPAPVAPAVVGDPFGELETMLSEPSAAHRTPGESPVLNAAGSPVLKNAPGLTAPRSALPP
jgi:hypothetical protein